MNESDADNPMNQSDADNPMNQSDADNPMNQSDLEADTCNRCQARENARELSLGVTPDWLKNFFANQKAWQCKTQQNNR